MAKRKVVYPLQSQLNHNVIKLQPKNSRTIFPHQHSRARSHEKDRYTRKCVCSPRSYLYGPVARDLSRASYNAQSLGTTAALFLGCPRACARTCIQTLTHTQSIRTFDSYALLGRAPYALYFRARARAPNFTDSSCA